MGAGILGFDAIMRLQKWLTIAMIAVTLVYIVLTVDHVDLDAARSPPSGSMSAVVGATVLVMTGFGVGWVNSAADYSRYLPRSASTGGVVGWPTFGGSLPVVVLVSYGVLLCASDDKLSQAVALDPIGALTTILPTWFLVPFALVAVGGLVSGAVLDIYSSGLTLLTLGLRTPRWVAAAIDGVLMVLGTIYIVWIADDFLDVVHGVPDHAGRPDGRLVRLLPRRPAAAPPRLRRGRAVRRSPRGYGSVNVSSGSVMVVATVRRLGAGGRHRRVLGIRGRVVAGGYLLEPARLRWPRRYGPWAYANLGVPVALVLPFVLYVVLGRSVVRRQESTPVLPG